MIKLHPDTTHDIARLINTILAADIMCGDEPEVGNRIYWAASEFKAVIELAEVYGIETSSYAQATRCMAEPMYRDAQLS